MQMKNIPKGGITGKKVNSEVVNIQIEKNKRQKITVEEFEEFINKIEKFYEEHPCELNVFALADLIISRLRSDRDLYAVVEGMRGGGKSNFLLLLMLVMCRNAGYYRHRVTGDLVKLLPRKSGPDPKFWERLTVNFDFENNLSFLDNVKDLEKKFHGLDRYMPFGIDEGSKNLHKQNWQSKVQFKLVQMSDTERYQNKAFFICIPNFKELNSVFRNDRVFVRIYIYHRNTAKDFASAVISMRDPSRWNIDPWFLDENSKTFEEILRRKPAAARTPEDIIKAERKLKGYAGEIHIPSIKTLAPKIWDTYMKYKIDNAKKELVDEEDEDSPDKRKINELSKALSQLMRATRKKIESLTGKKLTYTELAEITGLKLNVVKEIDKDTSWVAGSEIGADMVIKEKLKRTGL